jgi:prevent-host-death family protein
MNHTAGLSVEHTALIVGVIGLHAEVRRADPEAPRLDRLDQPHEQVNTMPVVTYSHARNALKSVLDQVVQDADVTIISRRDAEGDAVVISLDPYNSIMETLHLTWP